MKMNGEKRDHSLKIHSGQNEGDIKGKRERKKNRGREKKRAKGEGKPEDASLSPYARQL